MARIFDGPLSQEDVDYLRARFSAPHVDRQIELLGLADASEKPEDPAGGEGTDEGAQGAEKGDEVPALAEEDDLIGDPGADDAEVFDFDVIGSTESEVKAWAETASEAHKAEALAVEQGRGDRDPRKGVVNLLS